MTARRSWRPRTWQLLAVCVVVWGTTWHAITYQIGHASAELGVVARFALAGAVVLGLCVWRRLPLRFGVREHLLFALQGGFLYGVSYVCVYQAERHVASGLVAVGYSASPLLGGLGARLLWGTPLGRGFVAGGLAGLAGVALIFWPEVQHAAQTGDPRETLLGAGLTIASVLLSSVGSLAASRNKSNRLPFWPAMGWGMVYGALAALAVSLASGVSLQLPAAPAWWVSLAYLALAGSVLTFACFLELQNRIGPGPTGSVGVMTPLLALAISIVAEGFRPEWLTLAGALLAVGGNALMLRGSARAPVPRERARAAA